MKIIKIAEMMWKYSLRLNGPMVLILYVLRSLLDHSESFVSG